MDDGPQRSTPSYQWAQWMFLRVLAAIYFIAFTSFWIQAQGLIGHNGILPVDTFLEYAGDVIGPAKYRVIPTLFWLGTGDTMFHLLCGGGAALSVLLGFGIAPAPVLLLLWAFYLSLCSAGQEFMEFQWDILLLETGFLAIFLAPPMARNTRLSRPSGIALWMLRWLLFRLMVSSGIVKLLSGDPAWRGLSALRVHYETQPLPTWIGWYAHQLPAWFQSASTIVMFVIEIGVPLLIFAPARVRRWAFWPLVALQVLILLTGNYCFFNLLTIALCVLLLDDGAIPARWRLHAQPDPAPPGIASRVWSLWMTGAASAFLFLLSLVHFAVTLQLPVKWPQAVADVYRVTAPFRSVNGYGLFAVMTTERPEIVVEGSRDGVRWQAYGFKYKPGDVKRRPAFVAPHQPRLDWQMWFAALGTYQQNRWFISFCGRLLSGERSVLSLLAYNPFPDGPPAYVRARLFRYHFSDLRAKSATGQWWTRKEVGEYCPVLPVTTSR